MNLCDGDCPAAVKVQELQQLVAGMDPPSSIDHLMRVYPDEWLRVLELLDIPTF